MLARVSSPAYRSRGVVQGRFALHIFFCMAKIVTLIVLLSTFVVSVNPELVNPQKMIIFATANG